MSLVDEAAMMTSSNGTSAVGRNIPTWTIVLFLMAFPLIFQFFSPIILAAQHPEFAILKTGAKVVACTENAELFAAPYSDPLQLCEQSTDNKTIYCAYNGAGAYTAPQGATREQTALCPTLVSNQGDNGTTYKKWPVHPIDELSYRAHLSFWITLGLILSIGLTSYIRDRIILSR
jgi:hypothetical protein